MKDMLVLKVKDFLKGAVDPSYPLLIGFSGGPDSLALVHILLEVRRSFPIELHLAHVDHSWRQESAKEAEALREMAKEWGLAFHLKTLCPADFKNGNSENLARSFRYQYFLDTSRQIGAQAVILAHQQDDLAETVLKRMFEGSGFFAWAPMKVVSDFHGIKVLRPLLKTSKTTLLGWLAQRDISNFILDGTNLSPDFLRGRMRTEIFPYLEELFGKNIISSLCAIAEDVAVLSTPLLVLFKECSSCIQDALLCTYLDFSELVDLPICYYPLYIKYLLSGLGLTPSRDQLQKIHDFLISGAIDKEIRVGGRSIFIERGCLFILKEWPVWPEAIFLNEGVYSFDKWKCSVHWDSLKQGNSDWRGALNGVFCLNIQYSNYILASGSTLNSGKGKYFFLKRLSGSKVPTFCRRLFPFLVYNDEVIHEFLSGSSVQKNPDNQSQTLSIQLSCGDK
ncbi:MAG: tRNA lysidine(34) synthetase TilS [Chlamydiae bacterium]|nr:tRNA lysidine(34) synthetase TilS [Chlamydiota bacterium]